MYVAYYRCMYKLHFPMDHATLDIPVGFLGAGLATRQPGQDVIRLPLLSKNRGIPMDTLTGLIKLPPQNFAAALYARIDNEPDPITASNLIGAGLGWTGPHHFVSIVSPA